MNAIDIKPDFQGKVRDIYDLGDQLLMVATDRISAFDYILDDEIPYKGQVLTQLSLYWFDYLSDIVENHVISANVKDLPEQFKPYSSYLKNRFMLVKKAKMFPIECIVRGYLTGSGLKDYQQSGSVCGISLPEGLVNSSPLPHPIYTPSTKASIGDHDENISYDKTVEMIGEKNASKLRDLSIEIYKIAANHTYNNGIIIADTKLEFGIIDNAIILGDEVLTPDSSRFWSLSTYEVGKEQPSFDKQFVRNWLNQNWDKSGNPPHLPENIIEKTSQKYIQAYEIITGKTFER